MKSRTSCIHHARHWLVAEFKIKRGNSGTIVKCIARLVARGDIQDLDYASVFDFVVKYTTLRVLLAFTSYHNLEIVQTDVVTAFHNADDVVSDVYMDQPEGCHMPSAYGTRLGCKLATALYGIRKAPRGWSSLFS